MQSLPRAMNKFSRYLDEKLINFFERGFRKNREQLLRKAISASSYNYLMSELSGGLVLPYNAWSISPQGMMTIVNHILVNDIRYIVEFGTGISTVFLNNLAIKNKLDLKIISVDHDEAWQNSIKNKYNVTRVDFVCAPLSGQMSFKTHSFPWFDTAALSVIDRSLTDLVIIDAPIGNSNPYERAGAFEFYRNELKRANFSCYMDDSNDLPLREVMSFHYPDARFYPNFSIAGAGRVYEAEPVIFTK